jgi:hypothetical protein
MPPMRRRRRTTVGGAAEVGGDAVAGSEARDVVEAESEAGIDSGPGGGRLRQRRESAAGVETNAQAGANDIVQHPTKMLITE